jgi:hypothetical protein
MEGPRSYQHHPSGLIARQTLLDPRPVSLKATKTSVGDPLHLPSSICARIHVLEIGLLYLARLVRGSFFDPSLDPRLSRRRARDWRMRHWESWLSTRCNRCLETMNFVDTRGYGPGGLSRS